MQFILLQNCAPQCMLSCIAIYILYNVYILALALYNHLSKIKAQMSNKKLYFFIKYKYSNLNLGVYYLNNTSVFIPKLELVIMYHHGCII